MNKELLKEFITTIIGEKQALLANNISDDDKALINSQIETLNQFIEKLDATEDNVNPVVEELKNTLNEMGQRIDALNEKLNQANNNNNNEEDNMELNNTYLSSRQAVADFANAIRNASNGKDFASNWKEALITNGITIVEGSEDAYLPDAVKGMIQDIWDRNADWLKDLKIVGAKRYKIRKNDSAQDNANSRAKGWKKGDTKTSQELTFSAKEVSCQFIYKLQELSLEDEWNDDGSLVQYVVNELVDQILYEEKRAILVGDGRADNATGKINKIEAVAKSTADAWTNVTTVTDGGFLVDDMRAMVDGIHNPNNKPVYVFMNKSDLRTLARVQASSTSTPVYIPTEQVCEQIGCTKIITTDLLGGDSATYTAIAMIPSEYVLIGENVLSPVLFTQHDIFTNSDVWRYECPVGGAIEGLKSTAVLKA